MKDKYITKGNPFPNEMEIYLNMLGALMLDRIRGHVHSANVVTVNQGGVVKRRMQLNQKLAQPRDLSNCIGNSMVLSLSARARDGVLTFR